jgi:Tol biopolymer transport system component
MDPLSSAGQRMMKRTPPLMAIAVSILSIAFCRSDRVVLPVLKGPYLGQQTPGMKPEVFAPGIVSRGPGTRDLVMTPDGKEIYFSAVLGNYAISTIMVTKEIDGVWTAPEVMSCMQDPGHQNLEPCLSPDGKRFYFVSERPDPTANEAAGDPDIWVMDRVGGEWSEPRNLGGPVNTDGQEYFPSVTRDGTLYFSRQAKGSPSVAVCRSRFVDGKFEEPEKVPLPIGPGENCYNTFVAPDESYMIAPIEGRKDASGGTDYYVFFRDRSGAWSEPANMGDAINRAEDSTFSASVSPDGRYLFFVSRRFLDKADWPAKLSRSVLEGLHNRPMNGISCIFWVSAEVIEERRKGGGT